MQRFTFDGRGYVAHDCVIRRGRFMIRITNPSGQILECESHGESEIVAASAYLRRRDEDYVKMERA